MFSKNIFFFRFITWNLQSMVNFQLNLFKIGGVFLSLQIWIFYAKLNLTIFVLTFTAICDYLILLYVFYCVSLNHQSTKCLNDLKVPCCCIFLCIGVFWWLSPLKTTTKIFLLDEIDNCGR